MKYIILEKENGIAKVIFHRPEALNALCSEMINEIESTVDELAADDEVRVVVFTGEGKSFISGADISEMDGRGKESILEYGSNGARIWRKIETMKKPTISAVNGYCFGGGFELMLATDIRVANEKASFRFPEVSIGIVPGFNATIRLPKQIGMTKAKDLLFTGRRIFADEAMQMGIISRVFSLEEFPEEVMKLANQIADNSMSAIALVKESITKCIELPMEEAMPIEAQLMTDSFGTPDQIEGFNSFKEKRGAKFR